MREPLASRILRCTLYGVFVLAVLLTITLPFMMDTYFRILYDAYSLHTDYRAFIMPFLMFVGAGGAWIALELILMLRSIPANPFVLRNVRALKRVGIILAVLAAAFGGKCFVYNTFLTVVGTVIFILACLFAFTLASLFSQAVAFREENDLTI
ncbi:MAG: DUF2975 domain-containing protein [Oscillospiraceae bacterium]|nr:DUF2975 domain-containing protein [Oscillospiraceae bacterium]